MLESEKISKYFVMGCVENFPLLPFSLKMHENFRNILILVEKREIFS